MTFPEQNRSMKQTGNFESYTVKVDSLPDAATTLSGSVQKPVSLKYVAGGENVVCPVAVYGLTKTTDTYFAVGYKMDFTTANTITYTGSSDADEFHLTSVPVAPATTNNYDIECGAKGGQYMFANCLTNYTSPTLGDLSFRLTAFDVGDGTETTESIPTPTFVGHIDTANFIWIRLSFSHSQVNIPWYIFTINIALCHLDDWSWDFIKCKTKSSILSVGSNILERFIMPHAIIKKHQDEQLGFKGRVVVDPRFDFTIFINNNKSYSKILFDHSQRKFVCPVTILSHLAIQLVKIRVV